MNSANVFLRFTYTNHKGIIHEYVVAPVAVRFLGPLGPAGYKDTWVLDAHLVTKDGKAPEWGRPLRSFQLTGMRDVHQVVEDTWKPN